MRAPLHLKNLYHRSLPAGAAKTGADIARLDAQGWIDGNLEVLKP